MSVVARERLVERAEQWVDRADNPSLPRALGALGLDPDEHSEDRQVVEAVLDRRHSDGPDAPRDAADGEPEPEVEA